MTNSIIKKVALCMAACTAFTQAAMLPVGATEETETELNQVQVDENMPDFSILGKVTPFTESQTKAIAEAIYTGLRKHDEMITFDRSTVPVMPTNQQNADALEAIYTNVVMLSDAGVLANRHSGGVEGPYGMILGIKANYVEEAAGLSDEAYFELYDQTIAKLDAMTAGMDESWSETEKAMYLYGVVTDYCVYDKTQKGTLYQALYNKVTLCEGYTWLYGLLLHRAGIEYLPILSNQSGHMWNYVKVDDSWYHVDVAYGDAFGENRGLVNYNFFLVSSGILETRADEFNTLTMKLLTGEKDNIPKSGTKYMDAIWFSDYVKTPIRSRIVPFDGKWAMARSYYSEVNGNYSGGEWILWDIEDDGEDNVEYTVEVLHDDTPQWYKYDYENQTRAANCYRGNFSVLQNYNDDLIFTYPESVWILRKLESGEYVKKEFCYLTDDKKGVEQIFGMFVDENGKLIIQTSADKGMPWKGDDATNAIPGEGELVAETTTTTTETTTTTTTTTTTETTTTTTTTTTEATTTTTTTTTTEATTTTTTATETDKPEITTTVTTKNPTDRKIGDANGDGYAFGIIDLIAMRHYLLGYELPDSIDISVLDLTGDNIVDSFDMVVMKRVITQGLQKIFGNLYDHIINYFNQKNQTETVEIINN